MRIKIMVKCGNGEIEINGSRPEIMADITILLRKLREHITDEEFDMVIKRSKMSNTECIMNTIERVKSKEDSGERLFKKLLAFVLDDKKPSEEEFDKFMDELLKGERKED